MRLPAGMMYFEASPDRLMPCTSSSNCIKCCRYISPLLKKDLCLCRKYRPLYKYQRTRYPFYSIIQVHKCLAFLPYLHNSDWKNNIPKLQTKLNTMPHHCIAIRYPLQTVCKRLRLLIRIYAFPSSSINCFVVLF